MQLFKRGAGGAGAGGEWGGAGGPWVGAGPGLGAGGERGGVAFCKRKQSSGKKKPLTLTEIGSLMSVFRH